MQYVIVSWLSQTNDLLDAYLHKLQEHDLPSWCACDVFRAFRRYKNIIVGRWTFLSLSTNNDEYREIFFKALFPHDPSVTCEGFCQKDSLE